MIQLKRVYDSRHREPGDGKRILVDRLWPRGLKKDEVVIDEWMKDLAPSSELRKWYSHEPAKWQEFKQRYKEELKGKRELLARMKGESEHGTITFLYGAKDVEHNNAVVLQEILS